MFKCKLLVNNVFLGAAYNIWCKNNCVDAAPFNLHFSHNYKSMLNEVDL